MMRQQELTYCPQLHMATYISLIAANKLAHSASQLFLLCPTTAKFLRPDL